MCTVVYIRSDKPLPRIPWDEKNRGLHTADLDKRSEPVRAWFSLPHVCYLGADTFCGCGFQACEDPAFMSDEETASTSANRAALVEFCGALLEQGHRLELFSCWDGDENHHPRSHLEITLDQLKHELHAFEEGQMLRFTA